MLAGKRSHLAPGQSIGRPDNRTVDLVPQVVHGCGGSQHYLSF
jgi:hypothetical protein